MLDPKRRSALSKMISHALRHEPWVYELELDDAGWAPMDAVLAALADPRWPKLASEDVIALNAAADKQRFEITGGRIRAIYGHSLPGRLSRAPAPPPQTLHHGTSAEAAELIQAAGLKPMGRQYVHLSVDEATAVLVGARKTPEPVVLSVAAADAHRAGVAFYRGNDAVWLADVVPPAFIVAP